MSLGQETGWAILYGFPSDVGRLFSPGIILWVVDRRYWLVLFGLLSSSSWKLFCRWGSRAWVVSNALLKWLAKYVDSELSLPGQISSPTGTS